MPADFKDNTMRTYFRLKFEQFNKGNDRKDVDACKNMLPLNSDILQQNMDFPQEHCEKRKVELEYLIAKEIVVGDDIDGKSDIGNFDPQAFLTKFRKILDFKPLVPVFPKQSFENTGQKVS